MALVLAHQVKLESANTDLTINHAITRLWDLCGDNHETQSTKHRDDTWVTAMQVYLDDYFENQPLSPDTDFLPTPSSAGEHEGLLETLEPRPQTATARSRKTNVPKQRSFKISKSQDSSKNNRSRHSMTTRSRARSSAKFFRLDMSSPLTKIAATKKKRVKS